MWISRERYTAMAEMLYGNRNTDDRGLVIESLKKEKEILAKKKFNIGDLVSLNTRSESPEMIIGKVVLIHSETLDIQYECWWWNDKEQKFESKIFPESVLR